VDKRDDVSQPGPLALQGGEGHHVLVPDERRHAEPFGLKPGGRPFAQHGPQEFNQGSARKREITSFQNGEFRFGWLVYHDQTSVNPSEMDWIHHPESRRTSRAHRLNWRAESLTGQVSMHIACSESSISKR